MDWFSVIWLSINGVLALTAFVLLIWRHGQGRVFYSPRVRMLAYSHRILVFACVVGSIENPLQGNPVGGRTALATAGLALAVIALTVVDDTQSKR
jgi:hypothetical protein